jgi:hypothetical protein
MKSAFLHELLGLLGDSKISLETFWKLMGEAKLTDADIDRYCDKHGGWTPDPEEVR